MKKLETGLFKIFLVVAHRNGQTEKINEFFTRMAHEIHSMSDWKDWFYFQFCRNPEEHASFAVYFTKQYQETLFLSVHNFLATIFQSMPLPAVMKSENETAQIRKLQEENAKLRQRLQASQQQPGSTHQHQSRQQMFLDKKIRNVTSPSEISPFDIAPPAHLVDDFFIIAQESLNMSESQSRGFKSLIRNISSGPSPVLGRKENADGSKSKRSGSVGSQRSSWMNRD